MAPVHAQIAQDSNDDKPVGRVRVVNPDRRTVRARHEAMGRWVCYHNPSIRDYARQVMATLPLREQNCSEDQREQASKMLPLCNYRPYVRNRAKQPRKVEMRRLRRALRKVAA